MEPLSVKDSSATEVARLRNNAAQKRLDDQLKRLGDQHQHDRNKTFNKILEAKEALREVNPSPRQIVCPFGLTTEQKEEYRTLQRRSLPSISLSEFDKRLEEVKQENSMRRKSDVTPCRKRRTGEVTNPAGICGRRVGDPVSVNFSQTSITPYTEIGSPLLAQKNKLKDVLKRANHEKIFGVNGVTHPQHQKSICGTPNRN
ncbi:hypothetical protein FSP39_023179 [Pinctada imbricata]|uniref:Uncharacterized protein n=1 Tax=Pinctada imbricata TaxID=66713 RepID=A0AA89BRY7_PINIB|nr:hypothetical protein FSP39_023179 [Pinctada imbricata]